MANRKSLRIPNSSAYMGSGNKIFTFNQKARRPFQKVSDVYKREIKKGRSETSRFAFKKLNEAEKLIIKTRIRTQQQKEVDEES